MWKRYNANPRQKSVGDCVVRSISTATGQSWEKTYVELCGYGLALADMPSANSVWGSYLREHGFNRSVVPDACPDCYSVREFANDHHDGTYILALSGHVVAVIDGDYYDTWDSGIETPIYFWRKY